MTARSIAPAAQLRDERPRSAPGSTGGGAIPVHGASTGQHLVDAGQQLGRRRPAGRHAAGRAGRPVGHRADGRTGQQHVAVAVQPDRQHPVHAGLTVRAGRAAIGAPGRRQGEPRPPRSQVGGHQPAAVDLLGPRDRRRHQHADGAGGRRRAPRRRRCRRSPRTAHGATPSCARRPQHHAGRRLAAGAAVVAAVRADLPHVERPEQLSTRRFTARRPARR